MHYLVLLVYSQLIFLRKCVIYCSKVDMKGLIEKGCPVAFTITITILLLCTSQDANALMFFQRPS